MKKTLSILATGAAMLAGQAAFANFTGAIDFDGGATIDAGLTKFTSISATVEGGVDAPTGAYARVPVNTAPTVADFTFIPAPVSITPLWTFPLGTTTYSFDATSVTVVPVGPSLRIFGSGIASITGLGTQAGFYTITIGTSGDNFTFGSTAATTGVPDGGLTVSMLG